MIDFIDIDILKDVLTEITDSPHAEISKFENKIFQYPTGFRHTDCGNKVFYSGLSTNTILYEDSFAIYNLSVNINYPNIRENDNIRSIAVKNLNNIINRAIEYYKNETDREIACILTQNSTYQPNYIFLRKEIIIDPRFFLVHKNLKPFEKVKNGLYQVYW